jgi:hypothetical protein
MNTTAWCERSCRNEMSPPFPLSFTKMHYPHHQVYPTFSKRCLLRGSDEEKIRALFNYETIPFYEHRRNAETEGVGGYFLYHFGRQLPPTKWDTLEADALELQQSFRKFASHR